MTPETCRTDPLAALALAVVAAPLVTALGGVTVRLPWLVAGVLAGGALGVVSLVRIARASGRLRGRPLAIAAVVAGFGLATLLALFVCLWVAVVLLGGE